jgi:hypothetical protein
VLLNSFVLVTAHRGRENKGDRTGDNKQYHGIQELCCRQLFFFILLVRGFEGHSAKIIFFSFDILEKAVGYIVLITFECRPALLSTEEGGGEVVSLIGVIDQSR